MVAARLLPPIERAPLLPSRKGPRDYVSEKGVEVLLFSILQQVCVDMPDKIYTFIVGFLCEKYPASASAAGAAVPADGSWASCCDHFGGGATPAALKKYLASKGVSNLLGNLMEQLLLSSCYA